jgi:hypothetical protein
LKWRVVARSLARDDVIVAIDPDEVAIVHLTYNARPETPPWPRTQFLATPKELDDEIERRD